MIQGNIKKILFDNCCLFCGNKKLSGSAKIICKNCLEMFLVEHEYLCRVCGHPVKLIDDCSSCRKLGVIYYDSYKFLQFYSGYFKRILYMLKYEEKFLLIRLFYYLIRVRKIIKNDGIVTVVPDTFIKKTQKGKSSISSILNLFKNDGFKVRKEIYRKRYFIKQSQKQKDRYRRLSEIQNMFYLPGINFGKFSGKVYLIDDLYTTGATLNYGAKLLKQSGFNEVVVISFFRAKLY